MHKFKIIFVLSGLSILSAVSGLAQPFPRPSPLPPFIPATVFCKSYIFDFQKYFPSEFYYNVGQKIKTQFEKSCKYPESKQGYNIALEVNSTCNEACTKEVNPKGKDLSKAWTNMKTSELQKCQAQCNNINDSVVEFIAGYSLGHRDCGNGSPNIKSGGGQAIH